MRRIGVCAQIRPQRTALFSVRARLLQGPTRGGDGYQRLRFERSRAPPPGCSCKALACRPHARVQRIGEHSAPDSSAAVSQHVGGAQVPCEAEPFGIVPAASILAQVAFTATVFTVLAKAACACGGCTLLLPVCQQACESRSASTLLHLISAHGSRYVRHSLQEAVCNALVRGVIQSMGMTVSDFHRNHPTRRAVGSNAKRHTDTR